MSVTWRPLFPSQTPDGDIPSFLISASVTSTSYNVQVTDLTHIWGESLTRKAIIERSREAETIIELDDDDDENMQVFLQKIKGAIEGQTGTSLEITVGDNHRKHGPPALSLNLRAEVKGFGTLKWPINLDIVPQHILTERLLVPIIQAQHIRESEETHLLDVLKEKDHVILKLVDKLEGQGADLGQVFPGVVGKSGRKATRSWVEGRVKGLAPFNASDWKKDVQTKNVESSKQLLEGIFTDEVPSQGLSVSLPSFTCAKDWWYHRSIINFSNSGPQISAATKSKTSSEFGKSVTSKEEDGFQVQATPPEKGPSTVTKTEETNSDDDDDLNVPSQAVPDSFPKSPPAVTKPPLKRIGGLSGRRPPINPFADEDTESEEEPASLAPRKSTEAIKVESAMDTTATEDEESSSRTEMPTVEKTIKPVFDESTASESDLEPVRISPLNKNSRSSKSVSKYIKPYSSDTESDSELPVPNKDIVQAHSTKPSVAKSKLGGLKKKPNPSSSSEEDNKPIAKETTLPARAAPRKLGGLRKQTPAPEAAAVEEVKSKPKLGGLKRKPTANPTQDSSEIRSSQGPGSSKIQTPQLMSDDEEMPEARGRSKEKEVTLLPRETSEERANRKRAELKRELEEKAAKAPVKKKRKF